MPLNKQTLARVHIDALAGFHINHLEGTQTLDFHQAVFLYACLHYGHNGVYKTLRYLTVHAELLRQDACQLVQIYLIHCLLLLS